MQLQNEDLKLSFIICLFTETFVPVLFSSFSQSTELILGVLKEKSWDHAFIKFCDSLFLFSASFDTDYGSFPVKKRKG